MTRRPICLLVNQIAGGKFGSGPSLSDDPAALEPDALAAALRKRGLTVGLHALREDDDVAALARQAAAEGRDVVVAGGDGTVGAAAAALVGTDATLGIFAIGSFNNVARGLDVPRRLGPAVEVIARGLVAAVDSGRAVRRGEQPAYFFESAGVGLDAELFAAAAAGEKLGLRAAIGRAWRAARSRRRRLRVTIDEEAPFVVRASFVTISNGPYYGFGFTVAAGADVTDGQLEISVFTGMSNWHIVRHFLAVARARHRYDPRIRRFRARHVTIEGVRRQLPAHVDGRLLGRTPISFEVVPGALHVFRDRDLSRQAEAELGEA